mmetsp:Transcript_30324/g.63361  ORF Transcript_30324/g.63361 Transcript_30324/m.63361 type:complete len:122 (+) Transcript_30324:3932-4297(+)
MGDDEGDIDNLYLLIRIRSSTWLVGRGGVLGGLRGGVEKSERGVLMGVHSLLRGVSNPSLLISSWEKCCAKESSSSPGSSGLLPTFSGETNEKRSIVCCTKVAQKLIGAFIIQHSHEMCTQ